MATVTGGPKAVPFHLRAKTELFAALWFLALWTPWFAWRWWYYGYPFPNTYYVKASGLWAGPNLASQMRESGPDCR